MNLLMLIYPVIHHLSGQLSLEQVAVALDCGADGAFLISHHGDDDELVAVAAQAKKKHPQFRIGINLLSRRPIEACGHAVSCGLDMVWADDMGVDSSGGSAMAESLSDFARNHRAIDLFASVAFKYRPIDPDPPLAAKMAHQMGFIPTTSGAATGSAPEVQKIVGMSAATGGVLAIASGMTPENVQDYAPHLSHILVSTGVSLDEHCIDPQRLKTLIANTKSPSTV